MGPDNRTITMATVAYIEQRAAARIPVAEIAREVRLPYWQVEQILIDGRVPHRK